jgi:hypothetical protein
MAMKCVVISQPMYFPWVGMHEQMRLAHEYVHYDDVAFSKGSFTNRVQVKTHQGSAWLTLPLKNFKLGANINQIQIDEKQHRATLAQAYAKAPFVAEMLQLVDSVFETPGDQLCEVAINSMLAVHRYFGFEYPLRFQFASAMCIGGDSSERVLAIVRKLEGQVYITGHGAKNYLAHEMFEQSGIRVEYIDYQKLPYPQLHGEFTPYLTALDLIANCGREGRKYFCSSTKPWREFLS